MDLLRNLGILFLVVIIIVAGWFALGLDNLTPEPTTPVSASWNDNGGVTVKMTVENIAYDCKLGKKMLDLMQKSHVTVPPPSMSQSQTPLYVIVQIKLPDGKIAIPKYYLRYSNKEFQISLSSCEVKYQ